MKVFNIHENKNFKLKNSKKSRRKVSSSQIPLFQSQVLSLSGRTSFEEALRLDEMGDPCAKEFYLRAIEEKENISDSYNNLGMLEAVTDTMKAFVFFLKAIKHNPSHCEAHFNIANLYFEEKDFRLAELHYKIAAEVDPAFPNIYFNLALVYIELNDFKNAEYNLNVYIDLIGHSNASDAIEILQELNNYH